MLDVLPPETVLEILTFLPVCDLHSVELTCKTWQLFLLAHEEFLYRNLVRRRGGYARNFSDVEHAKGDQAFTWLDRVHTWKELYRRSFLMEQGWQGKQKAVVHAMATPGRQSHRFKVDEAERAVIISSAFGGLSVADIVTDQLLWSLPKPYVNAYTHIEYSASHGFLAFNYSSHYIELWERSSNTPHPLAKPTQLQNMFSHDCSQQGRGVMRPVAQLRHSARTRAFRMVYPTLLVASQEAGTAYIWDIPTLTCQEIDIGPSWDDGTGEYITYVEVSEEHIFVCVDFRVKIFERNGGKLVLTFPPDGSVLSYRDKRQALAYSLRRDGELQAEIAASQGRSSDHTPIDVLTACVVDQPRHSVEESMLTSSVLVHTDSLPANMWEEDVRFADEFGFSAVHVSPDGRDFIAVDSREYLYYVRDLAKGAEDIEHRTTMLRFVEANITNLAFDGRRALIATSQGVYVLALKEPPNASPRLSEGGPPFTLHQISTFMDHDALVRISCAQLTETAAWITWNPLRRGFHITPDQQNLHVMTRNVSLVHYVNFTQVPSAESAPSSTPVEGS